MEIKHLVFDPEMETEDVYIKRISDKDSSASILRVRTLKAFKENLIGTQLFQSILINFGTFEFATWSTTDFEGFVQYILRVRTSPFRLIAVTNYIGQKKVLEKLNIDVISKSINNADTDYVVFGVPKSAKTIEEIQKIVGDFFNVPYEKMLQKTRKREIVQARQTTMFFAKMFTPHSLKTIGEHFGGRDHTTVIHSCQTIKDLIDTDNEFKQQIEDLIELIRDK